mgnify:FL=1
MKKFKQFFEGKLSLAQSFWIWLVLANLAFQLAIMLLGQLGLFLTYLLFISKIVYEVFAIIGVWRSATNYIKKKKKVYWGWLAKISAIGYALEVLVFTYILLVPVSAHSADVINYTCEKNDVSFMVYTAKAPYYQVVMPNQTNPDTKYSARVKKIKTKNGEDFQIRWATANYNQSSGTLVYYVYYQVMGVMAYSTSELNSSDIKLLTRNAEIDKQRAGRYKLKEDIFDQKLKAKKTKTFGTKCSK